MELSGQTGAGLRELCEEIKARIDYRSFYQRYCHEGRTSGAQFHTPCPIPSHAHSGKGSPSLSVDLRRGLFHCFSRDEGGDAIRFYELMHGVSFGRAVREIARDLGVGSLVHAPQPSLEELQQSGLFNAQAHLTFYQHRLLFPFYQEGRAVYLQARSTASGVESRWHNMRGNVPSLYNVDALENLASGAIVYLVEGFTDTLTLTANGFTAVGLVGAGGFKEEWLAPLARFRVVAALDQDAAGMRATLRYRELFAARGVQLAQLNLPTDVNDFFRRHASAALEFALLTEAELDKQESGDRIQKPE